MNQSCLENEYVKFWIEDEIIVQYFKPIMQKISLDIAKSIVRDRKNLSQGKKRALLVDVNEAKYMDKEARDYFVTEESIEDVSVAAFYLDNYVAWAGARLFLAFNKPNVRVEIFRHRKAAIEWLQANHKEQ